MPGCHWTRPTVAEEYQFFSTSPRAIWVSLRKEAGPVDPRPLYSAGGMNCSPPPRSLPDGFVEVRSYSGEYQRCSTTSVGSGEVLSVAEAAELCAVVVCSPAPLSPDGRSTR